MPTLTLRPDCAEATTAESPISARVTTTQPRTTPPTQYPRVILRSPYTALLPNASFSGGAEQREVPAAGS